LKSTYSRATALVANLCWKENQQFRLNLQGNFEKTENNQFHTGSKWINFKRHQCSNL